MPEAVLTGSHGEIDPMRPPSFAEAVRIWAYIGLNSFGGPAGQIAVMHRVLIDEKKWISEQRFLHALNYCMLLPGPEAQQLAIYIGWLFHGVRGGLMAGTLFVLPGVFAILGLSYLYIGFHDVQFIQALFFGLKAAVLAIVAEAVLRIGRRALKSRWQIILAGLAFVAIFFLNLSFPIIVAFAAGVGFIQSRRIRCPAPRATPHDSESGTHAVDALLDASATHKSFPAMSHVLRVVSIWGTIWMAPVVLLFFLLGSDSVYFRVSAFFSQAAVVTFGGAYSVLAYIAQAAVERFNWLQPGEMLDGLAMAETTPGPLIMVVQFVGFVATARNAGALHPMLAGTLGALITTWVTFAPCFLWIFLGAPYIEALRHNRALTGALSAITAAVVGVVLNLAVWFALHTIFDHVNEYSVTGVRLLVPDPATVNWAALALASAAMIATFRFHVGMLKVLAGCAIGGIAAQMLWR